MSSYEQLTPEQRVEVDETMTGIVRAKPMEEKDIDGIREALSLLLLHGFTDLKFTNEVIYGHGDLSWRRDPLPISEYTGEPYDPEWGIDVKKGLW